MVEIIDYLDEIENNVMSDLKDFQIATVERIDELYRQGQNRILVSDEVGLGKTLVARGTIAKFAKLRKEEGDDLVKVVYICSNATIAEQNIEKLRIVRNVHVENAHSSRLSMQHLNIFMQENDETILSNYIQLIPLTPQTSFVNNSQGIMGERALIYAILKRIPLLMDYTNELDEIFRHGVNLNNWNGTKDYWELQVRTCNQKSNGKYEKYMINEVRRYKKEIRQLIEICKKVGKKEENIKTRPIIRTFRMIFADISLNKLDPDLIIMDEFQRFRYLLNSEKESEMNKLTSRFFNMEDMRILMLSATPYKMYSTLDEIYEDDVDSHYSEFFEVMNFLIDDDEDKIKFRRIWHNYSVELKEFNRNNVSFISIKKTAENELYENICRTERITEGQLEDFIDDSDAINSLTVLKEDIESFKQTQKLLDDIGLNMNVPIDYIKSTPYIMSFMKEYQLKKKIERYFENNPHELTKMNKSTFWLNKSRINNYEKIPYNNSRLEDLMGHVLKDNAEKLLWIPPSMPYYELKGAFENTEGFSKTLIFSSWEMVPRMISSMVSYEIERKTIGKLKEDRPNIHYFMKNRYPSDRLRFNAANNHQMTLFALLYPSLFLIDAYNPKDCLNRKLSREDIENEIKLKIEMALDRIPYRNSPREDSKWYYLAPLLLDSLEDEDFVDWWFDDIDNLIYEKYYRNTGFVNHFNNLKQEYLFHVNSLGKRPDDLVDVLCDMAMASPAICAYRLYENEFDRDGSLMDLYIIYSMEIARSFINFMNLPESIAVIDLIYKSVSEDAYWKNVLKYSKDGNLQAVLDEYVHLISSGLYKNNEEKIQIMHRKLLTSFNLRTTAYEFDTYNDFKSRMKDKLTSLSSMRTHFAVSFTKGKGDDNDTNRKKSVRDAFNSPFRPFVLASTSIGQEGLDFHNYCRRIVHWNLPSNPIDLEQREGRINRFECLAIRQNIAKRYGDITFKTNHLWDELFAEACNCEKYGDCSDLIPYWGLNNTEDMVKIERIVPMYPFSRDVIRYDRLIKILSLYRLTLGQSRQEYLLDYIFGNYDVDKIDFKELFINLSPYYKSDVKNFNERYEKTDLDFLNDSPLKEFIEIDYGNIIFEESQHYNLPISHKLSKLTTHDNSRLNKLLSSIDINLSEYWEILTEKIIDLGLFDNLVKKDARGYFIPIGDIFMNMVRIEMLIHNGFLQVGLFRGYIEYKDDLFEYLFNQKDEIENELGFEVYWNKRKNSSWNISIFLPIDINNEYIWQDGINWHIFMAKRFDEVFSPKIRKYYELNPIKYNDELRTQYWAKLNEKLSETEFKSFQMPHSEVWYTLIMDNFPYSEGRIDLHAYTHIEQIKVTLKIEKVRQDLYEYLLKDKNAIEDEFGFELGWKKVQESRHIRMVNAIDIRDKNNWDEAIEWQLDMAERFKKVFNSRIMKFYNKFNL